MLHLFILFGVDDTAYSIFDWVEVLGIDEFPCCISRMAKLSLCTIIFLF